jgi:hypothetical protein
MGKKGKMHGRDMRHSVKREIMKHLYPVEMVRHHATEIGLTAKQIDRIHKVVSSVGAEIDRMKWDVEPQTRKLTELVKNGASKEQIYKQLDVILKYENKIKKKSLGLLIVIRDVLTPAQREQLDGIKTAKKADRGPGASRKSGRHHGRM